MPTFPSWLITILIGIAAYPVELAVPDSNANPVCSCPKQYDLMPPMFLSVSPTNDILGPHPTVQAEMP